MKILLRTVQKVEYSVDVEDGATVGQLRATAITQLGESAGSSCTLIFKGNVLKEDSQSLSAAGVIDNDFIIMLPKKTGGTPAASPAPPATATTPPAPTHAPPASSPAPAPVATAPAAHPSGKRICLTVATEAGDVIPIEVDSNETIDNVKAILEVETGIPIARLQVMFEGHLLGNDQRLDAAGVNDNDMLLLKLVAAAAPRPAVAPGGALPAGGLFGNLFGNLAPRDPVQQHMEGANQLLQQVQMDPRFLIRLKDQAPEIAQAIGTGNPRAIAEKLYDLEKKRKENELRKQAASMRLNANPLDVEAQREIENAIAMENINANLEQAMEYNPESFARVVMLYVDCEVNGTPIKAFVDSGAQMTIMGVKTAERMGLLRLMDKRYKGVAQGVGTSVILGRCHSVQMKLGKSFFQISVTVLEDNKMDFLFGLDNLRRHQCCIDLKDNVLRMGDDAVPFLSEGELDKYTKSFGSGGEAGGDAEMADVETSGTDSVEYPPEVVERFTNMGFSKEQALAALNSSGGDADMAASLLLSSFD